MVNFAEVGKLQFREVYFLDHLDRFYHLLHQVQRKELDVGPNTKDYLAHPPNPQTDW